MFLVPAQTCQSNPTRHLGTWHDPSHHFRNPCFPIRLEVCPSSRFAAGHSSALWGQPCGTLQPTWHIPGCHVGPKLAAPEGWPSSLAHWRGQDSTVNPWGGGCPLWGNALLHPNNCDWDRSGGLAMGTSKAVQGSRCHPRKYWVSSVSISQAGVAPGSLWWQRLRKPSSSLNQIHCLQHKPNGIVSN